MLKFLRPRGKREYKLVLEVFPGYCLCMLFVSFLLVLAGSISLLYFAPQPRRLEHYEFPLSVEVTQGKKPVHILSKEPLKSYNYQVTMSLCLHLGDIVSGLTKEDLKFYTTVKGWNSGGGAKPTNLTVNEEHLRQMGCSGKNSTCDCQTIFTERTIRFEYYSADILFENVHALYEYNLLRPSATVELETINGEYTVFETVLRAVFSATAILLFTVYTLLLLVRQYWKFSKTSQKIVVGVLFALVFFNNPFFFLDWFEPTAIWWFPLWNILCISTFGNMVLFFVMTTTHAILIEPKNRTLWKFFLPKVAVVGLNWVIMVIVLIFERIYQSYDVSFDLWSDSAVFAVLKIVVICTTFLALFMVFYFTLRVLSENFEKRISKNYVKRFRVFGLFTVFVICVSVIEFITYLFLPNNNAASELGFFPLFNYYCLVVAVLFLPSSVPEDDAREKIVRNLSHPDPEAASAGRTNLIIDGEVDPRDEEMAIADEGQDVDEVQEKVQEERLIEQTEEKREHDEAVFSLM